MTKLCPRGKAAAKRKFKVYPSAYANAYASKICAGKIKDPSGVKRKDFKGPKPASAKKGKFMNEIEIERAKRETLKRNQRRAQNRLMEKEMRKERQKKPSKTKFKGRDIEITFTDINPFTDAVEFKIPYGSLRGKSYPQTATYAQKASDTRFRSFAGSARAVDKAPKRISKKALGGFNNVGGHSVMGSPISVDVDGDMLSNASASDYYKDLLK